MAAYFLTFPPAVWECCGVFMKWANTKQLTLLSLPPYLIFDRHYTKYTPLHCAALHNTPQHSTTLGSRPKHHQLHPVSAASARIHPPMKRRVMAVI